MNTIRFQNQEVVELRCGEARALFAPQYGGRLLLWEAAGRRLIHWPDDADWSNPVKIRGGNPLLFPFIARHFLQGKPGFWQDRDGTVREMPIHGFARQSVFTAKPGPAPHSLSMVLRDNATTRAWYPYTFEFEALYTLTADTLKVALRVSNTGTTTMPFQIGHHFYFTLEATARSQTRLHLPAREWARQNPDGSIASGSANGSDFTLDDPALIDRFHIDPSFPVRIGAPVGIDIESDGSSLPWHAVTTWTEQNTSPFYCVEPWTGLPNGIHHGQGLRELAPGRSVTAACVLRLH
jgi:aldose 1-epimerase